MPRFVVLTHNHPFLHWDFMLEAGEHLRTWRLSAEPNNGGEISAESLPDHRLEYLDYEGPVSGNRGEVKQWDRGEYQWIQDTAEQMEVQLAGEKLKGKGVFKVRPTHHSPLSTQHSPLWTFSFLSDETSSP